MKVAILGAGLSGISTAFFLQKKGDVEEITIFEKEKKIGGLCRSINIGDYTYDIGPHILFSKDKEMLQLMFDVLKDNRNDLRRSNQIIYKGRFIQYPFENDLSKLPNEELNLCVNQFINNPYEKYDATNMLQFFLKTFGEGITNIYLRPYNEKIWKYDPVFMDTQMVDRIPKPSYEDILNSSKGLTVDGYLHQLYFSYPSNGGIEAIIKGFANQLEKKCKIYTQYNIKKIEKINKKYRIINDNANNEYDLIISTIPVQELVNVYRNVPSNIIDNVNDLKYNSIIICFVKTKYDLCGKNFAFMIPEKEIIFHRISKMDFLGEEYRTDGATYMVEITYRQNDYIDKMENCELSKMVINGLKNIGFVNDVCEADILDITRYKYAYVIYDLLHSYNMNSIRGFFEKEGVYLNGRFGNFEYWNMDRILRESKNLVERF